MKRFAIGLVLAASACSSPNKPVAPPPAPAGLVTPTPGTLSRIDPSVVEETDTYVIRRLPKDKYIKVDDRHIRSPIARPLIEFFKEDDKYYYVSSPKAIPGEAELKSLTPTPSGPTAVPVPGTAGLSGHDARPTSRTCCRRACPSKIRLEKVAANGLPQKGLWRASFEMADFNGDGILDIVCTTDRLGDGKLHIWIGDGKGHFTPWTVSYSQGGKPLERFSIDYGGVAVGDIDGDGKLDVVCRVARLRPGLPVRRREGKLRGRRGPAWPGSDFSSQAVVSLDADGNGKLDIVASRGLRRIQRGRGRRQDPDPVVPLPRPRQGLGGQAGRAGRRLLLQHASRLGLRPRRQKDVLTGSHYTGALTLLWRNAGDGTFPPVQFDAIEGYSYHFSTAPGTFGADRAAAFADGYSMQANVPNPMRACGITLYVYRDGNWTRQRAWRKKDFKAYLFGLAMGDLDGDRLDDIVFPDNEGRSCGSSSRSPTAASRRQRRPTSRSSIRRASASGWPTSTATAVWTSCSRRRWPRPTLARRAAGTCTSTGSKRPRPSGVTGFFMTRKHKIPLFSLTWHNSGAIIQISGAPCGLQTNELSRFCGCNKSKCREVMGSFEGR